MLPWWVAIIALSFGGVFGFFIAVLIFADERDDRP